MKQAPRFSRAPTPNPLAFFPLEPPQPFDRPFRLEDSLKTLSTVEGLRSLKALSLSKGSRP